MKLKVPLDVSGMEEVKDRGCTGSFLSMDASIQRYVLVYGGGMGGLKTYQSRLLRDTWRSLSKACNFRNGVGKWGAPANRFQVTYQSLQRLDTSPDPNCSFLHPNTTECPRREAEHAEGFVWSENVSRPRQSPHM